MLSINHSFPDHYEYTGSELSFADNLPIVCTEKDAAKLKHLELDLSHVWFLRISVALPDEANSKLQDLLHARAIVPNREDVDVTFEDPDKESDDTIEDAQDLSAESKPNEATA